MQTSFMHPPFGFALFYLRGIADTLFKSGVIEKKVESRDIYLGAIPWVILQLLLVVVVIFVPESVTMFLDKVEVVDLDQIKIEMPTDELSNNNESGQVGVPIEMPKEEPLKMDPIKP